MCNLFRFLCKGGTLYFVRSLGGLQMRASFFSGILFFFLPFYFRQNWHLQTFLREILLFRDILCGFMGTNNQVDIVGLEKWFLYSKRDFLPFFPSNYFSNDWCFSWSSIILYLMAGGFHEAWHPNDDILVFINFFILTELGAHFFSWWQPERMYISFVFFFINFCRGGSPAVLYGRMSLF